PPPENVKSRRLAPRWHAPDTMPPDCSSVRASRAFHCSEASIPAVFSDSWIPDRAILLPCVLRIVRKVYCIPVVPAGRQCNVLRQLTTEKFSILPPRNLPVTCRISGG